MHSPFFSVIIPTYNRAGLIAGAIKSVRAQTFTDWELIVVDDGSTDDTESVIDSFGDRRIKYIYQKNQEKCIARNNGISNASGLYITFLDNDDYYLPGHLEHFFNRIMQLNEPVAMLISGLYIEEDGVRKKHVLFDPDGISALKFIWENFIIPGAACIHRTILSEFRFSEKYHLWEDRHLWLRILTRYPLHQVNHYTTVLSEHKDRTTRKFYENISRNAVSAYFNCIEDLFNSFGDQLHGEISVRDKKDFIARKAFSFIQIAVKNAQPREFLYLLGVLLANKPGMILQPVLYKLLLLLPFRMLTRPAEAPVLQQ